MEAIETQRPVVALETTIYTHGFPYPENVALASHLESVVRANGGIPATVGVMNGVARVGLEAEELIELTASAGKPDTKKISRRDLAFICGLGYAGRKLNGGTTVSGTMVIAHLAGIKVLATGGLGGVHSGGESSMDISADLTELGRTRMAVVSSGCKSFLDIPRTLEYLETQGVCVATFADGRNDQVDFPAFWTRESGSRSPLTIENEKEAAAMMHAQQELSLTSGLLFANPIPAEYSIAKHEMDTIIAEALRDARESGSAGSENTPFLLKRIREITKGETIIANRALVEANVARGTKLAVHLSDLEQRRQDWKTVAPANDRKARRLADSPAEEAAQSMEASSHSIGTALSPTNTVDVIVAGSLAIDLSCDYIRPSNATLSSQPQLHTSNPASITQTLGGVGQNVATALHYLRSSLRLCSSVADDVAGSTAVNLLAERGLQTAGIQKRGKASHTAQYVAVNDAQKHLMIAMADMNILEDTGGEFDSLWNPHFDACKPKWLVVDANWHCNTLRKWLDAAKASGAKVAFEPVSAAKSRRAFPAHLRSDASLAAVPNHQINLATPNALELSSMHDAANDAGLFDREDWWRAIDSIGLSSFGSRDKLVSMTNNLLVDQGAPQQSIRLLPFIPCILTTLGEQGVLMTQMLRPGDNCLTSPDAAPYVLSRSTDGNDVVGGVYMRLFPPVENVSSDDVVSVNGVGDTFLGVLIAGLTKEKPRNIVDLVDIAQRGSVMALKSKESVSPQLSVLQNFL